MSDTGRSTSALPVRARTATGGSSASNQAAGLNGSPARRVSGTSTSGAATERSALLADGLKRPIKVRGYGGAGGADATSIKSGAAASGGSPPLSRETALPAPREGRSPAADEREDDPTVEGMARDLLQLLRKRTRIPPTLEPQASTSADDSSTSASYDAILYEHSSAIDKAFPPKKGPDDDGDGDEPDRDAPLALTMSDTALLLSAALFLVARLCSLVGTPQGTTTHSLVTRIRHALDQRLFALRLLELAAGLLDAATAMLGGATADDQGDTSLLTLFWGQAPLSSSDPSSVSCVDIMYLLGSGLRSPVGDGAHTLQLIDLRPVLVHPLLPCASELAYASGLLLQPTQLLSTPPRPTSILTTDEEALRSVESRHKLPQVLTALGWVDSFAVPAFLHAHALSLWLFYFGITIWLSIHSEAGHLRDWNPLRPRPGRNAGGKMTRVWEDFAWRWWVLSTIGYFLILVRSLRRGPLPQVPLRPRLSSAAAFTQFPFLLTSLAFLLRVIASLADAPSFVAPSYTLIAWSIPFFAAVSLVLPSNLPGLNPSFLHLGSARSIVPPAVYDAIAIERRLAELLRTLGHFLLFLVLMLALFLWSLESDMDVFKLQFTVSKLAFQPLPPPDSPINVQEYQGRLALFAGAFAGVISILFIGLQAPTLTAHSGSSADNLRSPSEALLRGAAASDLAVLDRLAVVRYHLALRPFGTTGRRGAAQGPILPSPLNIANLLLADAPAACMTLVGKRTANAARRKRLFTTAAAWRAGTTVWLWRVLVAPTVILVFGPPSAMMVMYKRAFTR